MVEFLSQSVADTEAFACRLAQRVPQAGFVALFGGLGMGKTAFARGFMKGLDYAGEVSSPTFALVHEYVGGKQDVFHFDLYRVTSPEDLYSTGFFDYEGRGILLTEWSENIEELLPTDCIRVHIAAGKGDEQRKITVEGLNEC